MVETVVARIVGRITSEGVRALNEDLSAKTEDGIS
jgi:hypothetical protein